MAHSAPGDGGALQVRLHHHRAVIQVGQDLHHRQKVRIPAADPRDLVPGLGEDDLVHPVSHYRDRVAERASETGHLVVAPRGDGDGAERREGALLARAVFAAVLAAVARVGGQGQELSILLGRRLEVLSTLRGSRGALEVELLVLLHGDVPEQHIHGEAGGHVLRELLDLEAGSEAVPREESHAAVRAAEHPDSHQLRGAGIAVHHREDAVITEVLAEALGVYLALVPQDGAIDPVPGSHDILRSRAISYRLTDVATAALRDSTRREIGIPAI